MPLEQAPLTEPYTTLSDEELAERIARRKSELGDRLVILGHHYQREEVIAHADLTGDSLKLARLVAEQDAAEFIVFCGVHFMAESADILSNDDQQVCLPNMRAGCAMADMADEQAVAAAIEEVAALTDAKVVPITYVNSMASLKAVTAEHDGGCCTSGNVRNVFRWALTATSEGGAGGGKIFAIPDQHLAANTAAAMGYEDDETVLYDPSLPDGGLDRPAVERATVIAWKGHCYVHQLFTNADVRRARQHEPDATIIVHPECPRTIVRQADMTGSTEQIIRAVADAPAGSRWYVGTEHNLVHRLAKRHPDKTVRLLSDAPARCAQMAAIDLPHLAWALDAIAEGAPVNIVKVDGDTARSARQAVRRMIEIKQVDHATRRV